MKLRLLLFSECNRNCKGCCNKDWDLTNLPKCNSFTNTNYEQILLTGGEPMLHPDIIRNTVKKIREQTKNVPIYMYTANCEDIMTLTDILDITDGITLTLHTPKDVKTFIEFNNFLNMQHHKVEYLKSKSLRLNVFHGISLKGIDTSCWIIKKDMKWIKNCPLPKDEVLKRL
jgi:organic radical activating enzyme